jgi:hypothetical protein
MGVPVMPFRSTSMSLLLPIMLSAGCAAQSFTIRTKGVTGAVEVRYFLTGSFGGYGSFVPDADKDGAYRIPLVPPHPDRPIVEPARSLKAIVWASGCQFQLISVDLVMDVYGSAVYDCQPLPTLMLTGAISPPPAAAGPLDVEVRSMAFWDHKFFGIGDGAVTDLLVAKAPLNADGRFQISIPDFSRDSVTNERQDACLMIRVLQHVSWNAVTTLSPPVALRYGGVGGLKILPDYGSEVRFEPRVTVR